jgi:hypothetical protein
VVGGDEVDVDVEMGEGGAVLVVAVVDGEVVGAEVVGAAGEVVGVVAAGPACGVTGSESDEAMPETFVAVPLARTSTLTA